MENKNKPAYPQFVKHINDAITEQITEGGMTKREIFAMAAMRGLLSHPTFTDQLVQHKKRGEIDDVIDSVSTTAINHADSLLKELEK